MLIEFTSDGKAIAAPMLITLRPAVGDRVQVENKTYIILNGLLTFATRERVPGLSAVIASVAVREAE